MRDVVFLLASRLGCFFFQLNRVSIGLLVHLAHSFIRRDEMGERGDSFKFTVAITGAFRKDCTAN